MTLSMLIKNETRSVSKWRACGDVIADMRTVDEEAEASFAEWEHRYLYSTIEKGPESARFLCESPTSLGADWFSYEENQLCHMANRTLFPACSSETLEKCFDTANNHIRGDRGCKEGVCTRDVNVVKAYSRIDDATKNTVGDDLRGYGVGDEDQGEVHDKDEDPPEAEHSGRSRFWTA